MQDVMRDLFMSTSIGRTAWGIARKVRFRSEDILWHLQSPWWWDAGRRALYTATPPLFIGGTGGSGTRVFARIAEAAGLFMGAHLSARYDADGMVRYVDRWKDAIHLDRVAVSLPQQMDRDLEAALIWHRRGMVNPQSPWGAKHPRLMYFLPHLHTRFPLLKFIHVVRDGRDMAFSQNQFQLETLGELYSPDLRSRLAGAPKPVRSIAFWSQANLTIAHLGRQLLGPQYLRVRFEDVCATPTPVIRQVFDFLGTGSPNLEMALASVDASQSIGRWRSQPSVILEQLHREGEAGLREFGYTDSGETSAQ